MGEQTLEGIKEFLQREEIQERIRQRILLTRSHVTVPIGGAVGLLGFSENQLRKWEEKGLLSPQREGKHRHYTLQDLDKLAVIRELIDAKFLPGIIPSDIDRIWRAIAVSDIQSYQSEQYRLPVAMNQDEAESRHINKRIEIARQELFSRYYASHALRLSLQLIREGIPSTESTILGLVLPLDVDVITFEAVKQPDELSAVGESLVGWLALSGSSHTLLTAAPSFEHPNQYRVYQLRATREGIYEEEDRTTDHTLLITDWKFDSLTLRSATVRIIRRLLMPLYKNAQGVRLNFGWGMRDVLDPATNLNSDYADYILNGLADIVVRLGTIAGRQRWRFCCILVPNDSRLPLQQRSLVVRAQSLDAPHKVGKTLVSPNDTTISISLRAYQSGQVIYRSEIYEEDISIALRELESPASAIAVPIDGGNDTPSAVLYIVADEPHAFDTDDQRMLRLVGRMVQEQLTTYRARWQAVEKLADMIMHPEVTDTFFELKGILSEDKFVQDIETLLKDIQAKLLERKEELDGSSTFHTGRDASIQPEILSTDVLSLISINIDHQSRLANRYGDQFAQNLSKVVGSSLQIQLRRIFTDLVTYKLYHACSGRFYLLLDGLPLEEARKHAERIRRKLDDTYEVSVLRSANENAVSPDPESMQLEPITVHVAVSCYTNKKLEDLLQRYAVSTAVGNVRALIDRDIDKALSRGRIEGGNVVITWNPDPQKRGFIRWSPNPSD
jgi:GGDEF domain-containing protein